MTAINELATLENAYKWEAAGEQYLFCLDLLGISAHDVDADRKVNALEDAFEEQLAGPFLTRTTEELVCGLVQAEELLKMYNYDRGTAAADGAEREFLEAEAIADQNRIETYDEAAGLRG